MTTNTGRLFRVTRLSLLLLACAASAAADEKEQYWLSEGGNYRVRYSSTLAPIEINRMHDWILHVETTTGAAVDGADITIDGGMPAHNHGMPTRPRVTENLGQGNYKVQGMRFHMNGEWQITITITANDKNDSVDIVLQL